MMAGYFGLVQVYEIFGYPNKRRAIIQFFRGTSTNRNTSTVNVKEKKWNVHNTNEMKLLRKFQRIYAHFGLKNIVAKKL